MLATVRWGGGGQYIQRRSQHSETEPMGTRGENCRGGRDKLQPCMYVCTYLKETASSRTMRDFVLTIALSCCSKALGVFVVCVVCAYGIWTVSTVGSCCPLRGAWRPQTNNPNYRGADKSLARPTSQCILFDGENISFDAIWNSKSSVAVACFLPGRAKDLSATLYICTGVLISP